MSMAPWWCGTIMATKSRSTSPEGVMPMSTIIFDMAVTLSVRNGISALEASRKCAAQIAAIYSASDCDFSEQAGAMRQQQRKWW
jgi:hypothetical protein